MIVSKMQEYVNRLRENGFTDVSPQFTTSLLDMRSGMSLIRPKAPRDYSIQVDVSRRTDSRDYQVVATVVRKGQVNRLSVNFDENWIPRDERKAQELEAILFRKEKDKKGSR